MKRSLKKKINSLQRFAESSNIDEKEKKGILGALDSKKLELEKLIEYRTKVQFCGLSADGTMKVKRTQNTF